MDILAVRRKNMGYSDILAAFKEAIWGRHTGTEQLLFIVALSDGSLPIAAYNCQLRALAVV